MPKPRTKVPQEVLRSIAQELVTKIATETVDPRREHHWVVGLKDGVRVTPILRNATGANDSVNPNVGAIRQLALTGVADTLVGIHNHPDNIPGSRFYATNSRYGEVLSNGAVKAEAKHSRMDIRSWANLRAIIGPVEYVSMVVERRGTFTTSVTQDEVLHV